MLRQLRSPKIKTALWIGLAVIVLPSFVFFYGWQSASNRGQMAPQSAAEVKLPHLGKVEVRQPQFTEAKNDLRERMAAYAGENGLQLDRGTVDQMIDTQLVIADAVGVEILKDFAKASNIAVSTDEAMKLLEQQIPAQYRQQWLAGIQQQGQTLEGFVANIEFRMLLDRIRRVVGARTRVTLYEAWLDYLLKNEKLVTDFTRFSVSDYVSSVTATEPDLQKHLDENKAKFSVPDQVEYDFILVNKTNLRNDVTVTEDQITSYYNAKREDFRLPRKARARQIFIARPNDADPTKTLEARVRATELKQRVAKGENFSELAGRNNEETMPPQRDDAGSTAADALTTSGGYLGLVAEDAARNSYGDDWTSAVFNLAPGAVSDVIETPRGFAVVKLEESLPGVIQSLDKVRSVVRERIVDEGVEPVFAKVAADMKDKAAKFTTLEKLAEATSRTVSTTPKVNRGAPFLPMIGMVGELREAIDDLRKGGRSEVLVDKNRILVITVKEETPAHDPPLAEARAKVEASYKQGKAREMARAAAEKLKAKAVNLDALRAGALEMGTTATRSREFTRGEAPTVLGRIAEFEAVSKAAVVGQSFLSAIGAEEEPSGFVVWRLAEKKEPSRQDFAKQLSQVTRELAERKAETLVLEFLRDRRAALDKAKAIRINDTFH